MNYIINPGIFYLLGLAEAAGNACAAFIFVFFILWSGYSFIWILWKDEFSDKDKETLHSPGKILKKFKIPLILSIAFLVVVPSKDTCYKMMVASQVTKENIGDAKETIQDVADYIVDAVKEIKKND